MSDRPHPLPHGPLFQSFVWDQPAGGRFWSDLQARAQELHDHGFTSVWMPCPCKGMGGPQDSGYAVYDLYDLGEFDQKGGVETRYGSRQAFIDCVATLNELGMTTLSDVVMNHRMGADEKETFEVVPLDAGDLHRELAGKSSCTAWTGFTFPGRNGVHNKRTWHWWDFTTLDTVEDLQQPVESDAGVVYRIAEAYVAEDAGAAARSEEFLMGCDVNVTKDEVREALLEWGRWFMDTSGVGGVRLDASKHLSAGFQRDWLNTMRAHTDAPVPAVAEYATPDVDELLGFIDASEQTTACFDFPLKYRLLAAAEDPDFDLRTLLDRTLAQARPDLAVTFVDNHDSDPLNAPGEWVPDTFKLHAYAFILLRCPGTPCVYAGDWDGREGGDGDLTSHREMLVKLLGLRRDFAYGKASDTDIGPACLAFTRSGDAEHPGVLVGVLNRGDETVVRVGTGRPDTLFVNALSEDEEAVTTDAEGVVEVPVLAGAIAVWVTA